MNLNERHVRALCNPRGGKICPFLITESVESGPEEARVCYKSYSCFKDPESGGFTMAIGIRAFERTVHDARRELALNPDAGNCSGPPDFIPHPQKD
jgi:hypothetical protein